MCSCCRSLCCYGGRTEGTVYLSYVSFGPSVLADLSLASKVFTFSGGTVLKLLLGGLTLFPGTGMKVRTYALSRWASRTFQWEDGWSVKLSSAVAPFFAGLLAFMWKGNL